MTHDEPGYLLQSREEDELHRLGFQHRVWHHETSELIKCAGFGPGQILMDVGSGPGYLSLDLSTLVGDGGRVIALDSSEKFIAHLGAAARKQGRKNIQPVLSDVQDIRLETASIDGAVVRWVLMFVQDVDAVLRGVTRVLKPGGVFAVMEYFQFRSMSLWPRGDAFRRLFDAVHDLIGRYGGDADIGGRMPVLLRQHGYRIEHLYPVLRLGRPGSDLWKWLEMARRNHSEVVDAGLITAEQLGEYFREWQDAAGTPGAFFTAPPLLMTVGVKE